jgi:hypothetical protein
MTRKPLPRWTSPRTVPSLRRLLGAAPAVLLLGGLLAAAAGCGEDDQHVPEWYPSGARPAPVPKVDAAALRAELPPPPPAEIDVEPAPPSEKGAGSPRGGAGQSSMAASGHLRLSGGYQADATAAVACEILAGRGLTLTFDAAGAPLVELLVGELPATGDYTGEIKVIARDSARTVRASAGGARVHLDIATVERPRLKSLIGGSFSGTYAGPGVQGEVAGSFQGCAYFGSLP